METIPQPPQVGNPTHAARLFAQAEAVYAQFEHGTLTVRQGQQAYQAYRRLMLASLDALRTPTP